MAHGKMYLVGVAVLAALGFAASVQANLGDEYMLRVGGGRTISSEEMAGPSVRIIDPSPVLRQLSKWIHR